MLGTDLCQTQSSHRHLTSNTLSLDFVKDPKVKWDNIPLECLLLMDEVTAIISMCSFH